MILKSNSFSKIGCWSKGYCRTNGLNMDLYSKKWILGWHRCWVFNAPFCRFVRKYSGSCWSGVI